MCVCCVVLSEHTMWPDHSFSIISVNCFPLCVCAMCTFLRNTIRPCFPAARICVCSNCKLLSRKLHFCAIVHERLPLRYARIFSFFNWNRLGSRVFAGRCDLWNNEYTKHIAVQSVHRTCCQQTHTLDRTTVFHSSNIYDKHSEHVEWGEWQKRWS